MFGNVSNQGNSSNKELVYTNISIAYDGYMGIINKVDISCGIQFFYHEPVDPPL